MLRVTVRPSSRTVCWRVVSLSDNRLALSAFDFTFPVIAAMDGERSERREAREVHGTAFPIGGGAFLTAAHVIKNVLARADGSYVSLGIRSGDRRWLGVRCSASETVDSIDLGVAHANIPNVKPIPWDEREINMLEEVWAAGYPHAFDRSAVVITVRAFRGHVVSDGVGREIPSAPPIYEVSFHAPSGLSGAALCRRSTDSIGGMVLGNRRVSMTVYCTTETLAEGGVVRELRQEESIHLGIAVKASALLDVEMDSLNGTVRGWLIKHGLLKSS